MPTGPRVMALKARSTVAISVVLLISIFVLPIALGAGSSSPITRTPWPKNQGVYIATSSETIPLFSRALSGFRPKEDNKDFWGHSFVCTGSIRIFAGGGWIG